MNRPARIVAYGDCNTLGFADCERQAWPEHIARELGAQVTNLGHTMSTTRELLQYARDYPPSDYDLALIQYGLVDSWLTFRHSPYVLYYPTNPWRKFLRKLVKKIKKYARVLRIHDLLGWQNVVPIDEYERNIEAVIRSAPATRFVLLGTAPNHDRPRNPRIEAYNATLARIAARHRNALFIDPYPDILPRLDTLYFPDGTHLNAEGQQLVARRILASLAQPGA